MAANLQTLAKEIDEDFQKVKSTPFGRRGIYYSVFIDEKQTSITARKTTRISYLIDTKQRNNTYTRLYIEDWQIGVILANLDDSSFSLLKSWLLAVYRGESVEEHRLKFMRSALHDGIEEISCESLVDIIYFGDVAALPSEIDTTFGFSVSSQSFIDFLCLTLSMEDSDKLRIELTKHCMLADLLKKQSVAMIHELVPQLKDIGTTLDIEGLYSRMNTQQEAENYDKAVFSEDVSKQYFGSLASEL
jgi:hypothetical protein